MGLWSLSAYGTRDEARETIRAHRRTFDPERAEIERVRPFLLECIDRVPAACDAVMVRAHGNCEETQFTIHIEVSGHRLARMGA